MCWSAWWRCWRWGRARCSRRRCAPRRCRRWRRRGRFSGLDPWLGSRKFRRNEMFAYYLDLALHSLKRNKVLTALMIIAIAVGIGASMTTLTVMHLLSGDPLPGKSAHIFYPQVDGNPTPGDFKQPLDVMDYQSAVDLWGAHRADAQTLV